MASRKTNAQENAREGRQAAPDVRSQPHGFVVEQAGGGATIGRERIFELQPTSIHQHVPVVLGSKNEVDVITGYHHAQAA